jgi:hypothetical protein
MDYIKKFTEYCVSIIESKKVEIPNKNLAQAIRRQEFSENCDAMTMNLKKTFLNEGSNIEKQALRENKFLTLEQLKEMQQIGDAKIKEFIDKAKDKFSEL